jgi:hypothetical protein
VVAEVRGSVLCRRDGCHTARARRRDRWGSLIPDVLACNVCQRATSLRMENLESRFAADGLRRQPFGQGDCCLSSLKQEGENLRLGSDLGTSNHDVRFAPLNRHRQLGGLRPKSAVVASRRQS